MWKGGRDCGVSHDLFDVFTLYNADFVSPIALDCGDVFLSIVDFDNETRVLWFHSLPGENYHVSRFWVVVDSVGGFVGVIKF